MAFDVSKKFQGIEWKGETVAEQPRLVAELALWSAMSDGELEDREVAAIVDVVRQIPVLKEFSIAEATEMLEEMVATFDSQDKIAERIAAVALSISEPALRRVSYQLACLCAASDGIFSEAEEDFLGLLQEVFEIGDGEAEGLVDELLKAD